jgi:hypothetical protein
MPEHISNARPRFADVTVAPVQPAMSTMPTPATPLVILSEGVASEGTSKAARRLEKTVLSAASSARRSTRRWKVRLLVCAVLGLAEVAFVNRASLHVPHDANDAWAMARSVVAAPAARPAAAAAPAEPLLTRPSSGGLEAVDAPAEATASTEAKPSLETPTVPADKCLLKTTGALGGRRIFVDDRTVGETPEAVLVKCGKVSVKIGSSGQRRTIDAPCGTALSIVGP